MKYRIIEKIFEDGHKEYMAQESRFGLFWRKYVLKEENRYGNIVRYICCGYTYESCRAQLLENLEQKEKAKLASTVKEIKYLKVW